MESFDHSIITSSIYKTQAIPVKEIVSDLLRLQASRQTSFLQEIRLFDKSGYAYTSPEFLRKVASHTLLPNTPSPEVDNIINSDAFNIKVWIKALNNKDGRKRKSTSFLLATSRVHEPEIHIEEYVALPKSWFKNEEVPYFNDTVVSVDPTDIYYWRTYEKTLKRSTTSSYYNKLKQNQPTNSFNPFVDYSIVRILREMSLDEV